MKVFRNKELARFPSISIKIHSFGGVLRAGLLPPK